ncbi:DUF4160 domain-containing protein [Salinarimonas chemoclinalis]|uniref:DUF4160 domain-containing protein n=1 Tax=Salinarimonas chemoclinalis TaxID=3241599 RepID=UPI003556424D
MARIASFGRYAVYIYAAPAEHPPPHFHLVGPDTNVSIAIRTGKVIEGACRDRALLAEVRRWATRERGSLLAKWEELNERR